MGRGEREEDDDAPCILVYLRQSPCSVVGSRADRIVFFLFCPIIAFALLPSSSISTIAHTGAAEENIIQIRAEPDANDVE